SGAQADGRPQRRGQRDEVGANHHELLGTSAELSCSAHDLQCLVAHAPHGQTLDGVTHDVRLDATVQARAAGKNSNSFNFKGPVRSLTRLQTHAARRLTWRNFLYFCHERRISLTISVSQEQY